MGHAFSGAVHASAGTPTCPFNVAERPKGAFILCRQSQGYYRVYVRENFCSWSDEDEPSKIQQLLDKAQHDMEYILNKGAVKLLLWSIFSSATIFLNKRLYTSGGFPYPLASTAVGQLTTALGGYVLIVLGVFPKRPLPHPSQAYRTLIPAALATSGTLFAGNYAYLTLSIAFMQMMKGFTPGLTLVLGVLMGKERLSVRLAAAVLAVSAGTAAAALLERRTLHFSSKGISWMMLSSLSESLRVVMIQTIGQPSAPRGRLAAVTASKASAKHPCGAHKHPCDRQSNEAPTVHSGGSVPVESPEFGPSKRTPENPAPEDPPRHLDLAETLMYVSGPAAIVLAVLSSFTERQGVVDALLGGLYNESTQKDAARGAGAPVQTSMLLAAVAVMSLLTNLAGYAAVQATSSLTFKIVGVVKNVVVIMGGVVMGERVAGLQMCGYMVSTLGTMYYSVVRSRLNRDVKHFKAKSE